MGSSNGSKPFLGTLRALRRLLQHRWTEAASRRALSPQALRRVGAQVSASEQQHTGQIRVVAEASLPWSYLRRQASPRERASVLENLDCLVILLGQDLPALRKALEEIRDAL